MQPNMISYRTVVYLRKYKGANTLLKKKKKMHYTEIQIRFRELVYYVIK